MSPIIKEWSTNGITSASSSRKAPITSRRSAIHEVEVAVLGGGPAGAATALALARLGYPVIVIERSDYNAVRIGETLPPIVRSVLVSLGVWEEFLSQNHCRSFGIHSAWGQAEVYANDFIFSPYGNGWHLDRARFDTMLAQAAENAGADVLREAQLISMQERNGRGWRVEIRAGGKQAAWDAKFLVDATGRASTIARKRGAIRTSWDHLIGVVAFSAPGSHALVSNNATLVEAVEGGWWYSAPLPNGEVVVAFMTDADIYGRASKTSCYFWNEELQKTKHTKARLYLGAPVSVPQVISANSSCLDKSVGKNWLAVGDAAMAFDPLSSQGVYKALETGFQAAEAVRHRLSGDAEAFPKYAAQLEENFDRYLALKRYYYGRERRWPDSLFWKRRHAARIAYQGNLATELRTSRDRVRSHLAAFIKTPNRDVTAT
jgi:flavin-dependent dehydrogenase